MRDVGRQSSHAWRMHGIASFHGHGQHPRRGGGPRHERGFSAPFPTNAQCCRSHAHLGVVLAILEGVHGVVGQRPQHTMTHEWSHDAPCLCIQSIPSRPPHLPGRDPAARHGRCALRRVSHRRAAAEGEAEERLRIVKDALGPRIERGERRGRQGWQERRRRQEAGGCACDRRHGSCSAPRLSRFDGATRHRPGPRPRHEAVHVGVGGVVGRASAAAHQGGAHGHGRHDASVRMMADFCGHGCAVEARPQQQQRAGRTMEARQLHVRPPSSLSVRARFPFFSCRRHVLARAAPPQRPCAHARPPTRT
eukprot:scaffold544_cov320-Pavlova_lutheri.AAC.35